MIISPTERASLFTSPDLHLFDYQGELARFRRMDRASYHQSIFLDRRISSLSEGFYAIPWKEIVIDKPPPKICWIFHMAHSGSTLLARALDRLQGPLVLREPRPLRQLGLSGATLVEKSAPSPWSAQLKLALQFAGRRYNPSHPTIVKANVPVNFILPEIVALQPNAPAAFLYFPLKEYLSAILRTPSHRQWVMNVTTDLQPAIERVVGGINQLDIAERAAALWLCQIRFFADLIANTSKTVSISAASFFADPATVLTAVSKHFETPLSAREVASIIAGDLFATHSKRPDLAFNNDDRLEREQRNSQLRNADFDRARQWMARVQADGMVPERFEPAIGEAPTLLNS